MATATVGSRVLFVEADLRRPIAARSFGIEREPGVSEVLLGEDSLDSAVQRVEFASRKEHEIGLDVLVAGGVLPPNPPQVIESQAMESLLVGGNRTYDLVVIDTPPLVLLPDAFPLLRRADGVLIVSRFGENRSDVAARLARDASERRGAGHWCHRQRLQAAARVIGLRLRIQLSLRLLAIQRRRTRPRPAACEQWSRPGKSGDERFVSDTAHRDARSTPPRRDCGNHHRDPRGGCRRDGGGDGRRPSCSAPTTQCAPRSWASP